MKKFVAGMIFATIVNVVIATYNEIGKESVN